MKHAKTIYRNGKNAEERNSAPTAQAVGRVRPLDKKAKGRRRNTQGQKQVCTANDVTNAFLTMQFLPRLQEIDEVQNCDKSKMEREFYTSLSNICEKFEIKLPDFRDLPFPYNISESLSALRFVLKRNNKDWKEVRLIFDNNSTYFAKKERYDTGMTLYYIPVIPLYTLLHKKETFSVGKLMLSVYGYLYQILQLPYYRNDGCYLNGTYEMLENWIAEDGADEETIDENLEVKEIGDFMKQKLSDPKILNSFGRLINNFKPKNDFDTKCFKIAKEFYALYKTFPHERMERKYYPLHLREESDYRERTVMMDDYISFCASIKGNLFESLIESVNAELQEYDEIDEPTIFVPYDGRLIEGNNFDFEISVFERLNKLIELWQESIY